MVLNRKKLAGVVLGAAALVAGVVVVYGGPLDPPPGAVSPTGHSLDEIFSQISTLGGNDCGPAVPGESRGGGTLDIQGIAGGGPGGAIVVESYRLSMSRGYDQSMGVVGALSLDQLTVTKNTDQSTPILAEHLVSGQSIQEATLTLLDGRGSPYYTVTLNGVVVGGISSALVKRCDGTTAHLEDVTFAYQSATFTDLSSGIAYTVVRTP